MSRIEVRDLRVLLSGSGKDIVANVSFSIEAGEVLGLVGESGSGKTTVGTALLGFARRGARIDAGSVRIDGQEILGLAADDLTGLRGRVVSYIPQDPSAALNPSLRIAVQLLETLSAHGIGKDREARLERVREVLGEVKLPSDDAFLRKYPHQLSGGQQQRVAIAMAFACRPKVIVLDEPTTGLDVTTQAHVLETVKQLCREHGVAALYVTHDLAVVAELADRVMVMYAGRTTELASRERIFTAAAHPYTRKLLTATPDLGGRRVLESVVGRAPSPGARPDGCAFSARCDYAEGRCVTESPDAIEVEDGHFARCFRAHEVRAAPLPLSPLGHRTPDTQARPVLEIRNVSASYGQRQILHSVSVTVTEGECVALVGESGSGKTTLSRCVIGLMADRDGDILYCGEPLQQHARKRSSEVRRELQYIFQSPYNSLNPRKTIGQIVATPLEHFFGLRGRGAHERTVAALDRVSLSPTVASQYPDQLSGGERQRVAIARALVCEPSMLVCDEITSALDVSVQASIVRLLQRLQREDGLSMLFVTHNLALVRNIADRVVVLDGGRVVESGDVDDVIDRPAAPYTQALLADTPNLDLSAIAIGS